MYARIFYCTLISIMFSFSLPSTTPAGPENPEESAASLLEEDGYCPRGYNIFKAFQKVVDTPKYKCYGTPSSDYTRYYCPNKKYGTCSGTYVKQEFCKDGKRVNLYHTYSKCTCGCVDKNFHGRNLNILDLSPCGCDDDLDGIIGVEAF